MKPSHFLTEAISGQTEPNTTITKELSIRSLLITVKKELKKSTQRTSLNNTIHSDLVMRCMVLG